MSGGFEAGIGLALERILVGPEFSVPRRARSGGPSRRARHIASATSSWRRACRSSSGAAFRTTSCSSLAERGKLKDPAVLEQQVRRMLADPRATRSSTTSPAQWLHLRNLRRRRPDLRAVPGLRRQPAGGVPARDGAVLRERAARGSQRPRSARRRLHVRQRAAGAPLRDSERLRQPLPPRRRSRTRTAAGLLGQGSILTVTSYPNRTSPVLRGKWVLENILGTPPPPPPPNVPALKERSGNGTASSRCASGWSSTARTRSAPAATTRWTRSGFALENFDAHRHVANDGRGTRRSMRRESSPTAPHFDGLADLRQVLLHERPEEFVSTVTERLLTYALGRGVEYYDAPVVRNIVEKSGARRL